MGILASIFIAAVSVVGEAALNKVTVIVVVSLKKPEVLTTLVGVVTPQDSPKIW